MKKLLVMLSLSLVIGLPLAALIVKCSEDKKEPLETVQTRNKVINTRVLTKDKTGLEFEILYEGELPQGLLKGHIYMITRHMVFQKDVLEILKHNSLEHLGDSLEYYITPIDSTFRVFLINTKYYLRPEVQELWDEYVAEKIRAIKAEEKAKNLEILYGK